MKPDFEDDGRTVANMDIDGMPQGLSRLSRKKKATTDITKKERRNIIKAYLSLYMPRLICIVIGLSITFILIWLWLH